MATFRDGMVPVLDALRTIPGTLGFRQYGLTVRTRTWQGGRRGVGVFVDSNLDIFPGKTKTGQSFKIRQITTKEIADSGGRYEAGDIMVERITPKVGSVGYTEDQIAPNPADDGTEIIYVVTGAHSGEYARIELRSFRPQHYDLVLRRRSTPARGG